MRESKLRKIKIAIILSVLLIIGISTFFIINNALKTATINIMVAPLSAKITLNGISYANSQTHKIKPGEYRVSIEKDNYFKTYDETFTINSGETKNLYLELSPIDGTNWYNEHPEDALPMDAIIDKDLIENNIYIQDKFPLLYELPITVEYYKNGKEYVYYVISYDVNDLKNPIVIIKDYSGNSKDDALERIKNRGYNLDDYKIEYEEKTSELKPGLAPSD